jgi:hypothetical protein
MPAAAYLCDTTIGVSMAVGVTIYVSKNSLSVMGDHFVAYQCFELLCLFALPAVLLECMASTAHQNGSEIGGLILRLVGIVLMAIPAFALG